MLQSLTGTYLMVFTAISLVAATLARPRDWIGARFVAVAPKLALAGIVSVVALRRSCCPTLRSAVRSG